MSILNSIELSIVIPVYYENEILTDLVTSIVQELESICPRYEIVFVNDNLPDITWDKIISLSKEFPFIKGICLSRNFGKEAALSAGIEVATGAAVIVMDGDLQHPPSLIPTMLMEWRKNHFDVVEGVKVRRGNEKFTNKIGSKLFYMILDKLSGYSLGGASDFKLMDRKVVNELLKMRERNLFFRGMAAWLGFNRLQIPFDVQDRITGVSKWSTKQLFLLAIKGITSFSSLPLHIISIIGYLFLIFSIIFSIYAIILKIAGIALSGFTTVIILLLFIGSLLMISMGIAGEYIARIYEEVKGRPRYVVADRLDKR